MGKFKSVITMGDVQDLGIYEAATMDGYWEDKAINDLQLIYLKGQLVATQSIHTSMGDKRTLRRIQRLKAEIAELSNDLR